MLLLIESHRFFDSAVVPSFVFRKVEIKVSFARASLVSEPGNSRRVQTQEKNSGETVRRLGTIIQSSFCAQSGDGIGLNFWK